jgi:hypothetical protein
METTSADRLRPDPHVANITTILHALLLPGSRIRSPRPSGEEGYELIRDKTICLIHQVKALGPTVVRLTSTKPLAVILAGWEVGKMYRT